MDKAFYESEAFKNRKITRLTAEEETKVVALMARGDNYKEIRAYMEEHGLQAPSNETMLKIKKRNKENFDLIREKLADKEAEDALAIKNKANSAIKHRLDRYEKEAEILEKAHQQYIDGEIDIKEWTDIRKRVREANLTELIAVSREMHTQSRSDTDDDKKTTTRDLSALVQAIKSGDEVKLQQIIFNSGDK